MCKHKIRRIAVYWCMQLNLFHLRIWYKMQTVLMDLLLLVHNTLLSVQLANGVA